MTGNDSILRLVFAEGLPKQCLSPESLFQCEDWRLQLSAYYVELLWADKPFTITVLPTASHVWNGLERGEFDVYLLGNPLDEKLINRLYATSMLYRSVDVMFTKLPTLSVLSENPIRFWTSCFSRSVWICIFAILVLMCLTYLVLGSWTAGNVRNLTNVFRPQTPTQNERLRKSQFDYMVPRRCLETCFLIFALFFAIYDSNVKAMVYTSNVNQPFKNIRDLADQIRSGRRSMILERPGTDRWRKLTDMNETSAESITYLRNAVTEFNALTFEPDISKLCQRLGNDSSLVYFGSEKITESSCPDQCFWKYELPEELAKPVYFVISKKTIQSGKLREQNVNMYLHALHNYGTIIANRNRNKRNCNDNDINATYIKMDSLYVILYLNAILWGLATLILVAELAYCRWRQPNAIGHVNLNA